MRNQACRYGILGSILVGGIFWGNSASASGIATARFGAEHGTPVTTNPTAIYYNPAAIAFAEHDYQVYLDVSVALRNASFQHRTAPTDVAEPAGAQGANTDKASLFNVLAVPMFGATAKFGNFGIGAGVYVPFGGTSIWNKNDKFENSSYAGPVDSAARWYSINGTIQSTYYTTAAAYKFGRFSLGVSGNLVNSVVHTIRARTPTGSNDVAGEGRSYTDTSGWQGSVGLGAMYEAIRDKLWFGASYQSQPAFGEFKVKGTLKGTFPGAPETVNDVTISESMPDIIRLGARFRVKPSWELRLFGDYTRWSVFEQQCLGRADEPCDIESNGKAPPGSGAIQNLPRHWKDAFGVRVGTSIWPVQPLELMFGLGYDSNAIPDKNLDPALMDFNKFMVAIGGRYRIIKQMFGALTVSQFLYAPRDTNGASGNANWELPSKGPDAGGRYTQFTTVINANVMFAF